MATSEEHHRLTQQGVSWLRRNGFGVVSTELMSYRSRERPDVVGFRSSCSAIIEVKVSRSDFLVDQRKPERSAGGIGVYRFYLCPEGLIKPEDLPLKWGLLYSKGRSVNAVVKPLGNIWPAVEPQQADAEMLIQEWREFQHEADALAELGVLYSIARRLVAGTTI